MKTLIWIVVAMGVCVAPAIGALWYGRRRHKPTSTADVSPQWLNEHAYDNGKHGDRRGR